MPWNQALLYFFGPVDDSKLLRHPGALGSGSTAQTARRLVLTQRLDELFLQATTRVRVCWGDQRYSTRSSRMLWKNALPSTSLRLRTLALRRNLVVLSRDAGSVDTIVLSIQLTRQRGCTAIEAACN